MLYSQSSQNSGGQQEWRTSGNWRVSPLVIANQQRHIDQTEYLLREPGEQATLYWSLAEPVGLVLGFAQKQETLNPEVVQQGNIPLYHRRAGGTAVLVGPHLLSLDVMLPAGHPRILHDIVESYRWFGEAWVAALARLDIRTRVVPPAQAHAQRELLKQPETRYYESLMHRACYGTLSPYEVVAGQRKVVGLDMIRRRNGTLLQAGVMLHAETKTLADMLGQTQEEQRLLREGLPQRVIGVDALAGHTITADEVREVFEDIVVLQ